MAIRTSWRNLIVAALIAANFGAGRAGAEGPPVAGLIAQQQLQFPAGLDTDGSAVYIASSRNNIIGRVDLNGAFSVLAGQVFKQGSNDGTGTAAMFNSPDGLTYLDGALYISDTNNSDLRKLVLATKVVTTIAGTANISGTENGHGTSAHFNLPTQLCSDGKGTLYIADTGNSLIRKMILADGTVSTIGGQAPGGEGKEDGPPSKSKFNLPRGIATDGKFLYVADTANNLIRKIDLSSNETSTIAGTGQEGNDNGPGPKASFDHPEAMATDGHTLYITDADNHAIRKLNLADTSVTTLTLVNGHIGSGLAISKDGKTLYLSDTTENAVETVDTSNGNVNSLYPKQ